MLHSEILNVEKRKALSLGHRPRQELEILTYRAVEAHLLHTRPERLVAAFLPEMHERVDLKVLVHLLYWIEILDCLCVLRKHPSQTCLD
jgi:hypothetical protein